MRGLPRVCDGVVPRVEYRFRWGGGRRGCMQGVCFAGQSGGVDTRNWIALGKYIHIRFRNLVCLFLMRSFLMLSSNNTLRRPRILFFYPPRMIPVRRSSTFRSAFIFALEILRTCRRSKVILTGYFSIFILERNNSWNENNFYDRKMIFQRIVESKSLKVSQSRGFISRNYFSIFTLERNNKVVETKWWEQFFIFLENASR